VTPIIDIQHLYVERERVILRDVSWTVRRGENWVILGANGSGKSSLLSVLNGYFAETAGVVSICGATRGENDWREVRKKIGLVSSVISQMINNEELALNVVVGGRDAQINLWREPGDTDRRRALKLMQKTECKNVATQSWKTLSQGERQRVLIARALYSGLEILILDEPCSGLDPVAREHFLKMLSRLQTATESVPLVLVTHHVEEITPLFTHALLLKKGSVLASGKIKNVLNSENLSATFDANLRVHKNGKRFSLSIEN